MAMRRRNTHSLLPLLAFLLSCASYIHVLATNWPVGGSTKFYDFKVQVKNIKKLCKSKDIVTINGMFPGPVIYAQEDNRVIVKVTNETPYNATIHWHGVRQRQSCWFDGPSYITQCPIQAGQSFTYNFTLVQQKGTLFWHAHISWLRGTVNGAIIIYPKTGIPYPFPQPHKEHIVILGEYWYKDLIQLERQVLASGGAPPRADAYLINGHPGPLYNCSSKDVHKIDIVPGKTYLLRIINTALNSENFFSISNHKLTVVEADGEYTKPFTVDHMMITPGQTMNVLVTANQRSGRYSMALGPYMSGRNVSFQNIPAVAYFQYKGTSKSMVFSAQLPRFNDNLIAKSNMDYLRSLDKHNVPMEIDENLFVTVGLNVLECNSSNPNQSCQGPNNGILAASMNNITFVGPKFSLLHAYYNNIRGYFSDDFPDVPRKTYDFVHGAPNNSPNDTQSIIGTKVKVLEYGSRVQVIFQDTGIVTTENHPIHLHGYSFYVIGYGSGNYNPTTAVFNLIDPPYMNTIGVPVGGWAAIRFVADNPGVWFMHCHLEVHVSWGLSMALIVKNGKGPLETLPHPPADMPSC